MCVHLVPSRVKGRIVAVSTEEQASWSYDKLWFAPEYFYSEMFPTRLL